MSIISTFYSATGAISSLRMLGIRDELSYPLKVRPRHPDRRDGTFLSIASVENSDGGGLDASPP